jgi:hypothetical protein
MGKTTRRDAAIARSEAARLMGMARTDRKAAANREKGIYGHLGGRPLKPLAEIECNCGAGPATTGHKATCFRGQAIKRRLRQGKPLV